MTIHLRRATPADRDIVAEFNRRLAWESEGTQLDPAVIQRGVAAVLADPHKGFYTLAERDGEVLGQVLVTYEWSDWRGGWYWWIQSVYVREDARRGGVFRAIFEHLHAQAVADPEVIGLRLYVDRDNTSGQRTYESLGLQAEPYWLYGLYPLPGKASALRSGSCDTGSSA
jgi:GNAT superfamily N-acetyltransferase